MRKLLKELRQTNLVKVTGSYADGTQDESSDIDFYVKPNSPDYKFYGKESNMSKIIKILNKYKIKWGSDSMGYIHTHNIDKSLPISIEFSDLFKPRKNKLKTIKIMDIEFKTF